MSKRHVVQPCRVKIAMRRRDLVEARESIEASLALDPRDVVALYLRAVVLKASGDTKNAPQALREAAAATHNPTQRALLLTMAWAA